MCGSASNLSKYIEMANIWFVVLGFVFVGVTTANGQYFGGKQLINSDCWF